MPFCNSSYDDAAPQRTWMRVLLVAPLLGQLRAEREPSGTADERRRVGLLSCTSTASH